MLPYCSLYDEVHHSPVTTRHCSHISGLHFTWIDYCNREVVQAPELGLGRDGVMHAFLIVAQKSQTTS